MATESKTELALNLSQGQLENLAQWASYESGRIGYPVTIAYVLAEMFEREAKRVSAAIKTRRESRVAKYMREAAAHGHDVTYAAAELALGLAKK